jgi:hypothetical protein
LLKNEEKSINNINIKKPAAIQTCDYSFIITLKKQSNLTSPVMVSINDGLAWYYTKKTSSTNNITLSYELLEVAYMPTHQNRLVVYNELLNKEDTKLPLITKHQLSAAAVVPTSSLRRSKSMDTLTTKLLNTVLRW